MSSILCCGLILAKYLNSGVACANPKDPLGNEKDYWKNHENNLVNMESNASAFQHQSYKREYAAEEHNLTISLHDANLSEFSCGVRPSSNGRIQNINYTDFAQTTPQRALLCWYQNEKKVHGTRVTIGPHYGESENILCYSKPTHWF